MDKSAKSKLVNDIENRLDDFFGGQSGQKPPQNASYSIEKLKSAVLSIDWEITDECLSDLINEAVALLPYFEEDPITHALLRMLRALGRYIRKRKAQAHQDAIKRVMSVFASFEILASDSQISDQQKKQIVAKEILAFKKLKEQVEAQRSVIAAGSREKESGQEFSDVSSILENQKFQQAMNAVEKRINAEVKALKVQLTSLQRELDALRKT